MRKAASEIVGRDRLQVFGRRNYHKVLMYWLFWVGESKETISGKRDSVSR